MELIDMEARRGKKKEPCCDYCGDRAHKAPFACPRIFRITYYNDGNGDVEAVEVELRDEEGDDPDLAG